MAAERRKRKFYAVKIGRQGPAIYETWDEVVAYEMLLKSLPSTNSQLSARSKYVINATQNIISDMRLTNSADCTMARDHLQGIVQIKFQVNNYQTSYH
jgi:hypothetical protein